MSDNNLVNIKGMSDEQIMQAIGQDDGSSMGTNIPRLSINRTPEDDDGNQLPVGHFSTYDASVGQNVYGKPITFRPFISAMQYMHYDADKGEYVNRSIIFKSWKEEAIDILGGTRCGKISFKERSNLTPEQQEQQSNDDSRFERTFSFVAPSHVSMNQIPRFVFQRFREIAEFHIYNLLCNGISGADMRSFSKNRICFRESCNTAIFESTALLRKYIFFLLEKSADCSQTQKTPTQVRSDAT